MKTKASIRQRQAAAILLTILSIAMTATSCDKDEPMKVGYYFTVNNREYQKEMAPRDDKAYIVIHAMNDAIKKVYPKPSVNGNDDAVIRVCNDVYQQYRQDHPDYFSNFYIAKMYRGWMTDGVIKSSTVLATWSF